MIAYMAPLALLLLLFAFCGLTFLVTEAAACTVKAIARRWRGRRRAA